MAVGGAGTFRPNWQDSQHPPLAVHLRRWTPTDHGGRILQGKADFEDLVRSMFHPKLSSWATVRMESGSSEEGDEKLSDCPQDLSSESSIFNLSQELPNKNPSVSLWKYLASKYLGRWQR